MRILSFVVFFLFLATCSSSVRGETVFGTTLRNDRSIRTFVSPDSLKTRIPAKRNGVFRGADSLRTVVTDAVVVTGSRQEIEASRAPVAVEVIGAGRMQRAGTTNLQTILQEQSIVATRSSLQTGVQLMGMSADYTQILLDGLPL
ncbi:MAG: TonB-dependent receptor plug domain-containing protein, partial [Candidatus Kapaibacterium sp.]